jgi:MFS family permease
MLSAFVWTEARAAEPVLPLSLFRINTFALTSGIGFLVGMAMFGSITFLPMYLQLAKGVSPMDSALQLVPMMVGMIGTSMLSGFLMTRTGRYKLLPQLSTLVLTAGCLLLATMQLDTPAWQVAIYMFLVGAGIGPVNSVSITATQNAVPRAVVGAATAGNTLFRQIGGSIGVSIFGAIFSSGLAARLSAVMPEGAGSAGFSAQAVASLPEPLRGQMLEAFASALHPVFFTAAGVAILAFCLTFLLEELPLATTLRKEPEAEIDAEEQATAALAGAPASVRS